MRIPLPDMLRRLRDLQFESGVTSKPQRWGLRLWGWVARRPALYHLGARLGVATLRLTGRGSARSVPLAGGWTSVRDLPLPQGGTFQSQWRQRREGATR